MISRFVYSLTCPPAKKRGILPALLAVLTLCFVLTGCKKDLTEVSQTAFFFDTAITITLYEENGKPILTSDSNMTSEEILKECFDICAVYEGLFSRTMEGSDIWTLNHSNGAIVEMSPETVRLIRNALDICRKTDGAFDITIAPVSERWGFSSASLADGAHTGNRIPPAEDIEELLGHVDYKNIEVLDDSHVICHDAASGVDMGASAKGYIADRLKEKLNSLGVYKAIIDLGGNILCLGDKPDGNPFRLGVRKPFDESGGLAGVINVRDASLVTSGTYERCFEEGGRLYHHLLDSSTGYPTDNGILSVSILCPSSEKADLFSTACFLMGPEKGFKMAEDDPDVEAFFIMEGGELKTSGWPE